MIRLALTGLFSLGLLAQATPPGNPELQWVGWVLNGGSLAALLFLLVTDRLVTPSERDRLRQQLDNSHERERALNENIRRDVVPILTRSVEATTRNAEVLERAIRLLDDASEKKG